MPEGFSEEKLKAEEILIRDLFSFTYEIPIYQRPFSWTKEQFQSLVEDVNDAREEGINYFLGSLILKRKGDRNYEIVDGQQRLTSILILFAVARDYFISQENGEFSRTIDALDNYIKQYGDPLGGIPEKKRILPWNELADTFNKYVYERSGTKTLTDQISSGSIKYQGEDKPFYHLYEAISTFYDFIKGFSDLKSLNDFLSYLSSKVYLVYITTDSRTSAFRLFNVLNTRGLPLATADILKSTNLESIEEERKKQEYASKWMSLEDEIGREELDDLIRFVRLIFAKEKARREISEEYKNLFRSGLINKGTEFFDIIFSYSDIYRTKILQPDINVKDTYLKNKYTMLVDIMKMYLPFSEWIPPLLYFYYNFEDNSSMLDFLTILERKVFIEWCADFTAAERITSSVHILRLIEKSKKPEDVLDNLLTYKEEPRRGRKGRTLDFQNRDVIEDILAGKLDDIEFYTLKGGKMARYFLLRVDLEMWDENFPGYANMRTITVEHILPRKLPDDSTWLNYFNKEDVDSLANKLGNLALLSRRRNSKATTYDFQKKKEKYFQVRSTPFKITQDLQDYKDWSKENLTERHQKLMNKAKEIYLP